MINSYLASPANEAKRGS